MSAARGDNARYCEICGQGNHLFRCSKCKLAWYCSRSHQQMDWNTHKKRCQTDSYGRTSDHSLTEMAADAMSKEQRTGRIYALAQKAVEELQSRGYCVLDGFLGLPKASRIHQEVIQLNSRGLFVEGQLSDSSTSQNIRGDKITWVDGREDGCQNIFDLIRTVDCLITLSNDQFRGCNIGGRTKAMVACYPGNGTGYKYHVDNPSGDGRSITALYYLNPNWNSEVSGGKLRMYPELEGREIFIDPILDRLLLFWSDRRNPHQVEPSYDIRYAITLWYFDSDERSSYVHKLNGKSGNGADRTSMPSSKRNSKDTFMPS